MTPDAGTTEKLLSHLKSMTEQIGKCVAGEVSALTVTNGASGALQARNQATSGIWHPSLHVKTSWAARPGAMIGGSGFEHADAVCEAVVAGNLRINGS